MFFRLRQMPIPGKKALPGGSAFLLSSDSGQFFLPLRECRTGFHRSFLLFIFPGT